MKKTYLTQNVNFLKTLFLFLLLIGCEKNDTEIQNDSRPSQDLLNDIVKRVTNLEYDMFVGGDMGMAWTQQASKVQYLDEPRFIPRQSIIQNTWDVFYENVIFKSKEMYDFAGDEGNQNIMAISLVLKAYGFSRLTDLYGDIPFIEVQTSTPVYELQENIYQEIFDMLDEAIDLFNTSDLIDSSSDILYAGDANKWLRFANSLKFRCLMRVSNVISVENQLQEIINSNNLFQSSEDEAKRFFLGVYPDANPIYETIIYGNRTEWRASSVVVDLLNNSINDQRITKMVALNANNQYVGGPVSPLSEASELGELYLDSKAPAYLMSYSELEFLIAEAIYKGFISNGTVEEHYNKAITASFKANELESETIDFLNNNPYQQINGLEMIGNQKYISLYCQGVEVWTEFRRTGYPILIVPVSSAINEIPSRLNYPNSESLSNSANYNNAIQSQGPDELTTKIWWMQ